MSLVISVYSREAYREFLLPSINNADHSMVLHRSFFGLKEDLSIRLEILYGIWRICPGDNYLLYQVKRRMDVPCPLHDQDMFRIVTTAEEQISLLIQSVERPLSVFRKFGIAGCDQITIGRNEKNMIQYNNRDPRAQRQRLGDPEPEHQRSVCQRFFYEDVAAVGIR